MTTTHAEFEAALCAAEAAHNIAPPALEPIAAALNGLGAAPVYLTGGDPIAAAKAAGLADVAPEPWSEEAEAKLKSALSAIPEGAVPRSSWIDTGMALKRTGWGERAFQIWVWWSREFGGDKFTGENDSRAQWNSFKDRGNASGEVHVGSIFWQAMQKGWTWTPTASPTTPLFALSTPAAPLDASALLQELDAETWVKLETKPSTRFLGDVITDDSRASISAQTGIGKTLFMMQMAIGMASGQGFLHWECDRPARVLILDGEMPTDLIKERLADAIRRGNAKIPPGNLLVYACDRAEEFAEKYPGLGLFEPLNTPAGRQFVKRLVAALMPDVICFDNVMSLLVGDQKDEETWSAVLPLVTDLTKARIGQLWLDHHGHNGTRQYGTSTKPWRFDSQAAMLPLERKDLAPTEVGFTLTFEQANGGKHRRRKPSNWHDFDTITARLLADAWTYEFEGNKKRELKKPAERQWYEALRRAFNASKTPCQTTLRDWWDAAASEGIVAPIKDDSKRRDRMGALRTYVKI
ncbi:MAG TPA: AAA family ATPase, partial [Bradyrhizobium sp.]|nr:AAA family ATPase [Bradyrhizobium sp.]